MIYTSDFNPPPSHHDPRYPIPPIERHQYSSLKPGLSDLKIEIMDGVKKTHRILMVSRPKTKLIPVWIKVSPFYSRTSDTRPFCTPALINNHHFYCCLPKDETPWPVSTPPTSSTVTYPQYRKSNSQGPLLTFIVVSHNLLTAKPL